MERLPAGNSGPLSRPVDGAPEPEPGITVGGREADSPEQHVMTPDPRRILLMGVSHATAPVELRERLSFSEDEAAALLSALRQDPCVDEVLLLSTCNRVESLLVSSRPQEATASAKRLILNARGISPDEIGPAMYEYQGEDAVRHVFRVAASLDSMIVGEPQILGQIKAAYRMATSRKTSGVILNRLMHRAFFTAKRVRCETGIGGRAVSISHAAVELARKIFGDLDNKKVLLIGAGEMAELAVEHLRKHRCGKVCVTNRTFERGLSLARRLNAQVLRYEEMFDAMAEVDIIISSTGAAGHVVRREDLRPVMRNRRNRPLFFIDIAVPRDIDPEVNRLDNVYVYDIDDLGDVIDENLDDRRREAVKGERIVDEAVTRFSLWLASLDVTPTIKALRRKMETIATSETEWTTLHALSHLPEPDRLAIRRMTESIVNKILHDPMVFLKGPDCRRRQPELLDMVRRIFKLDE